MSSETSTDSQALQPWQFFVLVGLLAATALVYLQVFVWHKDRPAAILLSLTAAATSLAGLAMYRTFRPFTGTLEQTTPDMLGGRTRAGLEREKVLVLRSIKDLEFDRAMGKVSEKDFAEMSTRLRLRATGLMRQLDVRTGYREAIEREVERRVGALPATEQACPACRMTNDVDARFCKSCGARMEAA